MDRVFFNLFSTSPPSVQLRKRTFIPSTTFWKLAASSALLSDASRLKILNPMKRTKIKVRQCFKIKKRLRKLPAKTIASKLLESD